MTVYTYYTPCVGFPQPEQKARLEAWKKNWAEHGFDPVVLTPNDMRRSPHWFFAQSTVNALRKGSMPDQSKACFHRWFALEAVSRGAWTKCVRAAGSLSRARSMTGGQDATQGTDGGGVGFGGDLGQRARFLHHAAGEHHPGQDRDLDGRDALELSSCGGWVSVHAGWDGNGWAGLFRVIGSGVRDLQAWTSRA
jgi:hypothetical protein